MAIGEPSPWSDGAPRRPILADLFEPYARRARAFRLARPAAPHPVVARAIDEARPYRAYFPLAHPTATEFSEGARDLGVW